MHFLIVSQNNSIQNNTAPNNTTPAPDGAIRILYDSWNTQQEGDISLPEYLAASIQELRAEHAAWAYKTAFHRVPGGTTLAQSLSAGSDLSMWWISTLYERHPKVTPALYKVYCLRCLEKLLVTHGATLVEVSGLDADIAKAVGKLCKAHGWQFKKSHCSMRPQNTKSLLRTVYDLMPAPLQAAARLAHWLFKIRPVLRQQDCLAPSAEETGTIVTYFPNISTDDAAKRILHSRYWESLHTALEADAKPGFPPAVRWLFIRFPSPQGTLEQCKAWAEGFEKSRISGVTFSYLEEFLTSGDIVKSVGRWFSLAIASLRVQASARRAFHFSGSKLDLWPLLKDEYAASFRGWRCLERCLQQKGLENYVHLAGHQRWYTFPMENCPWERMLTAAVHREQAGPVYGAQHSTIRPTDFRYFDDPRTWSDSATSHFQPDAIAGNGESAIRQWRAAGVPESRLCKIEALRYLYLAKTQKKTAFTDNVLVVTSFFADETNAHLELLASCIRKGIIDTERLTVKPHPYLPVTEKLEQLLGHETAAKIRISTATMAEELEKAPLVWASNSTTAVLEAAIMGLPVMVMQPYGDFDLCPIQDVPGLVRTCDCDSVARGLKSPSPLPIDPDYLCLDPDLTRWRSMLDLKAQ